MSTLSAALPTLLVVEDSDEDFAALSWAMRQLELRHPVVRCTTGDDALDFLLGHGRHDDKGREITPPPALVLLDLNLLVSDGAEVLRRIKTDETLCTIPVVVWTTSSREEDVRRCYRFGANSYILKRVGPNRLLTELRTILHYWFDMVVLPDGGRA
jgi:CheY-like chemotaxis protein